MSSIVTGAYTILSNSSSPMTAEQITEQLIQLKLWNTNGKTPAATVGAALYMNIKKFGKESPFIKISRGLFAINPNVSNHNVSNTSNSKVNISRDKTTTPLSFLECAIKVLREESGKKPMHYKDITNKAIENKWLVSNGLTPEASMGAQIYTNIQKCELQGRRSAFTINKGFVGLSEWEGSPLEQQIEQHNEKIRRELLERVMKLTADEFEKLVQTLLLRMGFTQVEQTRMSGDHGIDVKGTLSIHDTINLKLAVQVKRWKNNIQAPHIQGLRGSLRTYEQGLFVTTSDFSKGAKAEAVRKDAHCDIALINGSQLIDNLVKYHLGVTLNRYHLLVHKDSFFSDTDDI